MKKLYIVTTILLMGMASMMAQTGIEMGAHSFRAFSKPGDVFHRLNGFGLTEQQFNSIKNDMYVNSTFLLGNIYEDGKEVVRDLPMRYNAYTDDIEVKQKKQDDDFQTLMKEKNVSVKIAYEPYVYVGENGTKEKSGFMNVLVDGDNYKLYKKTMVTFRPMVKAQTSYESDTPAAFAKTNFYYLVKDGNFEEIPSSKSKTEKMLDNEKSGMKSWIKKNKLKFREDSDLKKAVEQLNVM